jgi:hypothetical protein
VVEQPGGGMQANQPIAGAASQLVPLFDLAGQWFVWR